MDEEPVEILVGMAERGEMDPWNIDIVDVTDRFLAELERRKLLDLRISGRTLFYAATLLRMKAEHYVDDDLPDEEDSYAQDDDLGLDLDLSFDPEDVGEPMLRLEREIQRRIGRKSMRTRPVTLYELIKQLKTAEKEERRRYRRQSTAPRVPDMDVGAAEVVGLAHDEGYRASVDQVMKRYRQMVQPGDMLTLNHMSEEMGWSMRDVYIPLLFLMLDGKIQLWQEDFFGEIFVGTPDCDGKMAPE